MKYVGWPVQLAPRHSRCIKMMAPSLFAPSLTTFIEGQRAFMGFTLELLTTLFQEQGVAVAFASIAYPDPDVITRAERQYYQYQAHSQWVQPAFSLRRYVAHIQGSNKVLQELSVRHGAIYIPIAEQLTGGGAVFVDFCHMAQRGIENKAALMTESILPVMDRFFDEAG